MLTTLILLLLPLAVAFGWYAAKRNSFSQKEHNFRKEYWIGLQHLLNEQPDEAVDVFIKMLTVDSDTVETHLALGALFRRRGEVNRAIRIHQNLIARPQLDKANRMAALLALGEDYLRAGMLDRAERLFLEVTDYESERLGAGLKHLLEIYQQQKRWDVAITTAQKLNSKSNLMYEVIAQYYCELAENARALGQVEQSQQYLEQALSTHPGCVRASLLQAAIADDQGKFKIALKCYQRVPEQDSDYLLEIVQPLIHCYEQLGQITGIFDYLQYCLQRNPRISILIAMAEFLREQQGNDTAIEFFARQLQQRPSLRGLQYMISLQLNTVPDKAREDLLLLSDLVANLLKNKPVYRCNHCGFASKVLDWLCPGCKTWCSVKPILGLEGD